MSTTARITEQGRVLAGHNRISTQALTSLAQAAAAEALGVEAHDVRADWSDDDGLLALSVVSPIRIPSLASVLRNPERVAVFGGSIRDRAVAAKSVILERVMELSGAQLSRVDIRISGTAVSERGRVL
jgi:CO/xanthine dehydrogenase Mo-binding subunit